MDAGRLQGLAVRISSTSSYCQHDEQQQLLSLPSASRSWLKATGTGVGVFWNGRGKERKRGCKIVRAAVVHDITAVAAVAVAAATVLPMCWMYAKRSQLSTVNDWPPSESASSPHEAAISGGNGSVFSMSSTAVVEVVRSPPPRHETPRYENGAIERNGEPNADAGVYIEFEHRSPVQTYENGAIKGTGESNADSGVRNEFQNPSPVQRHENGAIKVTGEPIADDGVRYDFQQRSPVQRNENGTIEISGQPNANDGAQNEFQQRSPVQRGLGGDEFGGAREHNAPVASETLTSEQDSVWIEERREELEKALLTVSDRDVQKLNGNVNGKMQSISRLASPEASPSKQIPKTQVKTLKNFSRTWSVSKVPGTLAEILPVKESAGSALYIKGYEKLLRAGWLQDCIVLLEELDRLKMLDTDKIYHSSFLKACQRKKAVREGFRFIRLLSNPTLSTYNMLLCVCREARDVDAGLRVLAATEKAGFKPDHILYTSLISTCAKASKVDIAFKVYHEMETAGVTPSIETYGAMIDGCAQAGQIAKAFGVYGTMLSKQIKPDHVIFNSLINACGRAGAVERAFEVLADMTGKPYYLKPNDITIGALISSCARAGQVDRAFEVYKNMREWGIKGTPECYTSVVHACSITGNLSLAVLVYKDMERDRVKPDEIFFSALIDVAGQSKDVDAAFGFLDEMKRVSVIPGPVTYSALMGVCCNTGSWERALGVYKEVRAACFQPTVSMFNALITALCDAQRIDESFSVLQDMRQSGLQPDQITYTVLLQACEKFDEPERAFDLHTSGRAEGVVPNESMCASVIGICYARLKRKPESPNYACSIGLLAGQSSEAAHEQWASWALAVYRQAVAANVVPSIKSLSMLLGCLRVPEVQNEMSNLFDDTFFHTSYPVPRPSSILDGAGLYDPRALALFEEAALMGVVPNLNYRAGPISVNAESMPSYVAEVYMVTLLKALKQMHNDGEKLFPVTILYMTERKQTLTATREVKEITMSGRTGQALAALLRRLKIYFQGHESSGKLRISTVSLRNWLRQAAKTARTPLPRHPELGPPHTFVAQGIAEQQRAIRMGDVFKNSADIERVSGNRPFTAMYGNRRIQQINPWDRAENIDSDSIQRGSDFNQSNSRRGNPKRRQL